jgi:hypothetical protein
MDVRKRLSVTVIGMIYVVPHVPGWHCKESLGKKQQLGNRAVFGFLNESSPAPDKEIQ